MVKNDEIEQLKTEIDCLKGEIIELHNMFNRITKLDLKATTKHLQELYKRTQRVTIFSTNSIVALHDIVAPIEEKIFPGVSKAREQLATIVKTAKADANDSRKKTGDR